MSDEWLTETAQFDRDAVELLDDKPLYRGFFSMVLLRLRHRLFAGGWSTAMERELFVRGDAVAVLPYDPVRDQVALIEQFRIGALEEPRGPWLLEAVAGMYQPGEDPADVARRELAEETGIEQAELRYITRYFSSPGGTSEQVHLYLALCDLDGVGGIHGLDHEHEDIRVRPVSAAAVFAAMLDSRVNNAATLIALQWLQWHREGLRRESTAR